MKAFLALSLAALTLGGCVTDGTSAADPAPQPPGAALQSVRINGCCSFQVPAAAAVTSGPSTAIDGFADRVVTFRGETLRISPLLGSYGWLGAINGTALRVSDRAARTTGTVRDGMLLVIPLQNSASGRTAEMSLQIKSDCRDGTCGLFRTVSDTLVIEPQWRSR